MMTGWTIYDHPKDYPGQFVARKWTVSAGQLHAWPDCFAHPELDRVRFFVRGKIKATGFIPHRFDRAPEDEPAILEVWV